VTATIALWCVATLAILVGLAGTLLPVLPGAPLMFAGMALGAWIDDFERVSGWTLGLLGALALLTIVCDVVAAAFGAKRLGASPKAVTGAALGTVAGVFTGLWGLLVLPLVGAALGEWLALRDVVRAGRVGLATGVGLVVGTAIKLALAFAMLGIFVAALFL